MSDNIFNNIDSTTNQNQNSADANAQPNQQQTQFADLLNSVRNESGQPKYKDIPTAIDALKHSQDYISQLKAEKERLAAELEASRVAAEKAKELEATITRLTSQQQPTQQPASVIPEEVVANVVQQALLKREAEATQTANISQVTSQMQQAFGAEAEKVFYAKAQEIGLTQVQINALAAQSPQAVLKLFGMDQKPAPQTFSTTTGSVNTTGITPNKESFIGRNKAQALVGATTSDLLAERESSKKLVDELHSQGLSVHDLTDPKVFNKYFS